MESSEYMSWVARHRTTFQLPQSWVDSATEWHRVFESLSVTAAELSQATREMQLANAARSSWDHLYEVKALIGRQRDAERTNEMRRAQTRQSEDQGECTDCRSLVDGSGMLQVPHPRWIKEGIWVPYGHSHDGEPKYHTAFVCCRCFAGRRASGEGRDMSKIEERYRPPITIATYEAKYCKDWKAQMNRVREARKARLTIEGRTEFILSQAKHASGILANGMRMPRDTQPRSNMQANNEFSEQVR